MEEKGCLCLTERSLYVVFAGGQWEQPQIQVYSGSTTPSREVSVLMLVTKERSENKKAACTLSRRSLKKLQIKVILQSK